MNVFLNVDVVYHILEKVYDGTPRSLLSCALVSSDFHHASRPLILRFVSIDLSPICDIRSKDLLTRLDAANNPEIHYVHQLHIKATSSNVDSPRWKLFTGVLSKLDRLQDLWWSGGHAPRALVESLEQYRPNARLHVSDWGAGAFAGSPNLNLVPDTLCSSTALYELEGSFDGFPDSPCSTYSRAKLFKILTTSPGLRKLHLIGKMNVTGHDRIVPPTMHVSSMALTANEVTHKIESLSLDKCAFLPEHMIALSKAGCWSNLRKLEVDCFSRLQDIRGCEMSLECLTVRQIEYATPNLSNVTIADSFSSFLSSSRGIHCFKWIAEDAFLPLESLKTYGRSLRTLHIHGWSKFWDETHLRDRTLELERLKRFCPQLQDLGITIHCDGDWPYAYLTTIARYSSVKRITLFTQFDDTGPSDLIPLNESTIRQLFYVLRMWKTGESLSQLTVYRDRSIEVSYPAMVYYQPSHTEGRYPVEYICRAGREDIETVYPE